MLVSEACREAGSPPAPRWREVVERAAAGGARRRGRRRLGQPARRDRRRGPRITAGAAGAPPAKTGSGHERAAPGATTWILTGSLENFRINVERGFDVIGFKERRRRQASEFEPGDEIVFYVTGVQAFGGDRPGALGRCSRTATPIWPQGKKQVPGGLPVAGRGRAGAGPRRGRVRPGRRAGRRARARRQVAGRALAPGLPGPAADGRRPPTRRLLRERLGAAAAVELIHDRHFTRAEADALLPTLAAAPEELRRGEGLAHRRRGAQGPRRGLRGQRRRRRGPPGRARRSCGSAGCWRRCRRRDRGPRHRPRPGRLPRDDRRRARSICAGSLGEDGVGYWHELDDGFARPPAAGLMGGLEPACAPAERLAGLGAVRSPGEPPVSLVRHRAGALRRASRRRASRRSTFAHAALLVTAAAAARRWSSLRPRVTPPAPAADEGALLIAAAGPGSAILVAYLAIDRRRRSPASVDVRLRYGLLLALAARRALAVAGMRLRVSRRALASHRRV